MKKAVIYTRFSPRRNADESESCDMQEASCRKLADGKYEVIGIYNDPDVSGADEYREKLWQAIEALPRDGILLVYKRDRLARNVFLSEQINRAVEARGARIEAVSGDVSGDSPEHVMIRQVLSAIAEYERKLISARTSWAMKQHQTNGKRMSRYAPYGWQVNPENPAELVRNQQEQDAIVRIVELKKQGMNVNAIMNRLKSDGIASRNGQWSYKTVANIIERSKGE